MRVAAIDIGTNSLHMIVCQVRPDLSIEVIDREKEMVQLGRGGFARHRLTDEATTAAIETLSKFLRIARTRDVDEVVAAATAAVREAENGGAFIDTVLRRLRLKVRVISGPEEARLIHLAVMHAVDVGRQPAVTVDIGGGSVEVTLGTPERLMLGRSFKLGVIRLVEKYGGTGAMTAGAERRLVRHIEREFDGFLDTVSRRRFGRVIGTAGTILSLGALALGRKTGDVHQAVVPAPAISTLRKRILALPLDRRQRLAGLEPRRAELAQVGVVLLDTVLGKLGATDLTLCDYSLREGLLLDYIARNGPHIQTIERYPDVRRRSVIELAERCGYAPSHAQHVARLSLALFDGTRARHGLGAREREWLEYGALLHDIGTHISYQRHHRHSYYLIRHAGLLGFDPDEVERIALITRYHRQSAPRKSHSELASLPKADRTAIGVLAAFVRLAEALDRSHARIVERLSVADRDDAIVVRVYARHDAELEIWAAGRQTAPLAEALGVEVAVEAVRPRPARRATRAPDRRAGLRKR